jgi:MATE family multidrug resistance protein
MTAAARSDLPSQRLRVDAADGSISHHLPRCRGNLPAARLDPSGRRRVDYRAILLLAAPLLLNSVVQALLNLTDLWFASTLGTEQTAAMGANYFLVLVFILAVGGVGVGVQALVAQAYGAGQAPRASHLLWTSLLCVAATVPFFCGLAWAGPGCSGSCR